MKIPQKIAISLLLSAFLFAGLAFFAYEGIARLDAAFLTSLAVFLTLFLMVFFCFNLRQDFALASAADAAAAAAGAPGATANFALKVAPHDYAEPPAHHLEELEAVEDEPPVLPPSRGIPPKGSNVKIAFGDDDVPFLVETGGFELVAGDFDEIDLGIREGRKAGAPPGVLPFTDDGIKSCANRCDAAICATADDVKRKRQDARRGSLLAKLEAAAQPRHEAFGLEEISSLGTPLFSRPFAYAFESPRLLPAGGKDIIYEKNGIHYINSDFDGGESAPSALDGSFVKLIESVVAKK